MTSFCECCVFKTALHTNPENVIRRISLILPPPPSSSNFGWYILKPFMQNDYKSPAARGFEIHQVEPQLYDMFHFHGEYMTYNSSNHSFTQLKVIMTCEDYFITLFQGTTLLQGFFS